jgi:uncharacterized protein Yka (UPF0111/DUF47 family)
MQTNPLESISKALSAVNAATLTLSHPTKQNGESLIASGKSLVSLADEGTQEALDRADSVFQSIANEVLLLSQKIAQEIPDLTQNVNTIQQHAPSLAGAVDTFTPTQRKDATELLTQLDRVINAVSVAVDGMEEFSQLVESMKTASPEIEKACDSLIESIADLRALFNQNWFSLCEMASDLREKFAV